jgi:hypothetical protein
MTLALKNRHFSLAFLAFVAIFSIDIWSFQGIETFTYNAIEAAVLLCLALITLTKSGVFFRRGLTFKTYVFFFLLIPLPSIIGAYIYHDQSLSDSFYVNRYSVYWLFYFVLHIFNLHKDKIIKLMVFIGAVWAGITIVQQFTYPTYYFYSRDDEKKSIYRAGVYRYMLAGNKYGLFMLLYFFNKYLNTEKLKYIVLTLFGLAGFYYYGTRQTAAAAAACMVIAVLLLKGMVKWKNLILMIGLGLVVLGVKEILFAEYIEMTNDQVSNEDYIRILSGKFFLFDYWPNTPWGKLLGNGKPYGNTAYGQEIELLKSGLGFFRSDVGIIGSFNQFGLLYVFLVLSFCIKGISLHFKDNSDRYLKLYFFNAALLLILNEGFSSPGTIPFVCLLLYAIEKVRQEENEVLAEEKATRATSKVLPALQPA